MRAADQEPIRLAGRQSLLPIATAVVLGAILSIWVVDSSPTFQGCIRHHKTDDAYHALYEPGPIASRIARLHLQTVCIEGWMDEHAGTIGAVATLFVAMFTLAVWRATGRLWLLAEFQLAEFRRSLDESRRIADERGTQIGIAAVEAGRAAIAMQGVAGIMAEAGQTAAGMAEDQREFWQRQARAYLSVTFGGMVPQHEASNTRFEPRMSLTNSGRTPAYKVQYFGNCDLLPVPLPSDFEFPLPEVLQDGGLGTLGPRQNFIIGAAAPRLYSASEIAEIKLGVPMRLYAWGRVVYEDAFGISRFVNFCQGFFWLDNGNIMGLNTSRHNDSD